MADQYKDDHDHLEFSSEDEEERQEEEEEEEEALSLCDLPLNHNATNRYHSLDDMSSKQSRRSSLSEATEFFEFFNDVSSSDLCPADDIIFCGKLLVPFKDDKDPSPPTDKNQTHKKLPPCHRRRSESLSKLQSSVTRSNSASLSCGSNSRRFMMRSSRSLDYRRLHRSSSSLVLPAPEIERNPSSRSAAQSEIVVKKVMKPRWYSPMFGVVKVPPEMELNDMKNRQFRRNPSTTMFPPTKEGSGKVVVNRNSGKVSWKILKALSCKDHSSVSVTASFVVRQAY